MTEKTDPKKVATKKPRNRKVGGATLQAPQSCYQGLESAAEAIGVKPKELRARITAALERKLATVASDVTAASVAAQIQADRDDALQKLQPSVAASPSA